MMKIIAVIQADLETSPLGTASRLGELLCRVPVLTRTLRRVCAAKRLDEVVVVCPAAQYGAVCGFADGLDVTVRKFDGPAYGARETVRVARRWALDSWRGGLGNTCFFDEHTHPALCLTIANQLGAHAVASIAAEAPLVDPDMIDQMVAHFEKEVDNTKIVFAQSPPGLSPAIFAPQLLEEVAKAGMSPGWVNSYRPDQPQRDMINVPACYRPPMSIQVASGRLTSDTRRGFELLQRLVGETNGDASAEAVCRKLASFRGAPLAMPREIQIELTTDDQLGSTILRPRGRIVGRRSPLDLVILERMLQEVCAYDDTLLVLGGFGEPLLHPKFAEVLRLCRDTGVFGLAVRTNGLALDEGAAEAMLEFGVDVVQVSLDQARRSRQQTSPVIAASMTKARETCNDLEEFYDRWLRFSGWAVIEGYSDHAGLLEDRRVLSMAPPHRLPCRQLRSRCTVLADGCVVGCDQDFQGQYVVGDLNSQPLAEIWNGEALSVLRTAHRDQQYSHHPMCQKCDEWHRP